MAVQNSVPGQDPRDSHREEMLDDQAASVVRHEERLVINRQQEETGKLRLRKYVIEEPVRQEVTVGHDEPDVVRTPLPKRNASHSWTVASCPWARTNSSCTAPRPWSRPCAFPTSVSAWWPNAPSAPKSLRTPSARSASTSRRMIAAPSLLFSYVARNLRSTEAPGHTHLCAFFSACAFSWVAGAERTSS